MNLCVKNTTLSYHDFECYVQRLCILTCDIDVYEIKAIVNLLLHRNSKIGLSLTFNNLILDNSFYVGFQKTLPTFDQFQTLACHC